MIAFRVLIGLAALTVGADLLVRGASRMARSIGLSPLIIGLTVVGYGTSAPEFAVSMKAGLAGQSDIALGNVVGSNIFNILLILGVSALVKPLFVSSHLIRFDVPVMIGVSVLSWMLAADGVVSRWEGIVLVLGAVGYTTMLVHAGMKSPKYPESGKVKKDTRERKEQFAVSTLFVAFGLGSLVLGARWLVTGAVDVANALGVGELLIGLTIVAAGTSLPELATSVVASFRGERDIAVGNIVGSNIFNILAVLGASAAISGRAGVSSGALGFDIPVMTAVAVACLPIFFTGRRISRSEGALFTVYYAAYVSYLFLTASRHDATGAFGAAMLWFVMPGTVFGIGLSLVHAFRPWNGRHEDDGLR